MKDNIDVVLHHIRRDDPIATIPLFCSERTAIELAHNLCGDFGETYSVWREGKLVKRVRAVEVDA